MNQELRGFNARAADSVLRPTFLCIGQPHAGTTWLHAVLSSHPGIRLPQGKKDVGYFGINYHFGERWYLEHFPAPALGEQVQCVGEVDPMYIYGDLSPSRISMFGSIQKFIVLLRDPASWLVSSYYAINKYSPYASERSLFLKHHGGELRLLSVYPFLAHYFDFFDRENFLFVTMDEISNSGDVVKARLAAFLEVDADGFGQAPRNPLYNKAREPRFKQIYRVARFARDRWFREFEWITTVEARMPLLLPALFKQPAPVPLWLYEELSARRLFVNEQTERLGDTIGRDLSGWLIG